MNKKKAKIDIVYSTNPNYNYTYETDDEEQETLPPEKQKLYISLDKKKRNGKIVTLISGFIGKNEDLLSLEKMLKSKCATGGTSKDKEIIIQGDFKDKLEVILKEQGYKVVRKG
jgi:translation initiation factor 1